MSYCRMGVDGSQLYLYADVDGGYRGWYKNGTFRYHTLEEVWGFICKAKQEGVKIPAYVFEQVKWEMEHPDEDYDTRTI